MIPGDVGLPLLASLDARVEALLAASPGPVPEARIASLLPEGSDVAACLARIASFWEGRGLRLERGGDGVRLRAREELVPEVAKGNGRRLSEGAVATLAAIAVHQPIAVPQIEAVRNVRLARGIVESLERAGLVEEVDRRRERAARSSTGPRPGSWRPSGLRRCRTSRPPRRSCTSTSSGGERVSAAPGAAPG